MTQRGKQIPSGELILTSNFDITAQRTLDRMVSTLILQRIYLWSVPLVLQLYLIESLAMIKSECLTILTPQKLELTSM